MKICVVGAGYVGLSLAVMLSTKYEVHLVEISGEKVNLLRQRKSPIRDEYIEKYLAEKELNLTVSSDLAASVAGADFAIVMYHPWIPWLNRLQDFHLKPIS